MFRVVENRKPSTQTVDSIAYDTSNYLVTSMAALLSRELRLVAVGSAMESRRMQSAARRR